MTPDPKSPEPIAVSAVLPAWNERENLEGVVRELAAVLAKSTRDFEIIVVDDGSSDGTGELADRLARDDARVRVIHHGHNRGYGAALRSGFAAARCDHIFFTDADGQFDLNEFSLLAARADHPLVVGYRKRRMDPWRRRLYGRVFSLLIRLLFGVKARDINCAFKLFQRDLIAAADLTMDGALINAELFLAARRRGVDPIEVPVTHRPRQGGANTGGSRPVIRRAAGELLRLLRK